MYCDLTFLYEPAILVWWLKPNILQANVFPCSQQTALKMFRKSY